MYDIFGPIRGILKADTVTIDNNIFKLHYKATVFVLLACSLLLTQKQYFGDPIDCLKSGSLDQGLLDTYCWITSTYTLPKVKGPHHGVGNEYDHVTGRKHEIRNHTYYQWVTLVLYLQAVLFYVPRYLWKIFEGGRLKQLVGDLTLPVVDEEEKSEKIKMLVTYFWTNIDNYYFYAAKFFVCELLNIVNVLGQIYFTDLFVGYEFTSYGGKVLSMTGDPFIYRSDPMELVFPKVSKCNFHFVGPSGTTQIVDTMCVLPLNIFNEKIYIFLWFWFILVTFVSMLGMVYRISTFFPQVRLYLLRGKARISNPEEVDKIAQKLGIGGWFFTYQITKNVDPLIMRECFSAIAKEIP